MRVCGKTPFYNGFKPRGGIRRSGDHADWGYLRRIIRLPGFSKYGGCSPARFRGVRGPSRGADITDIGGRLAPILHEQCEMGPFFGLEW